MRLIGLPERIPFFKISHETIEKVLINDESRFCYHYSLIISSVLIDEILPASKLTGPAEVNTKLLAESSSLVYKRLQVLF